MNPDSKATHTTGTELRRACVPLLDQTDPQAKCEGVGSLAECSRSLEIDPQWQGIARDEAGRPERPHLVAPQKVPRRGLGTAQGRAALVHAICHIEFNAINLALDAVVRFAGMPQRYYQDWFSVAVDEARHFKMLRERLQQLSHDYGDLPAHDGLWQMAENTADDVLARMALVPRVLEARGLDVTPGMIDRLRGTGDSQTIAILEIILEEEVRHVAIGGYWFKHLCHYRGLDPEPTFRELLKTRFSGRIKPPFNEPARRKAGFSADELQALHELDTVQ